MKRFKISQVWIIGLSVFLLSGCTPALSVKNISYKRISAEESRVRIPAFEVDGAPEVTREIVVWKYKLETISYQETWKWLSGKLSIIEYGEGYYFGGSGNILANMLGRDAKAMGITLKSNKTKSSNDSTQPPYIYSIETNPNNNELCFFSFAALKFTNQQVVMVLNDFTGAATTVSLYHCVDEGPSVSEFEELMKEFMLGIRYQSK